MPDESKSGHEKDPNSVNGDQKEDPPADSDKSDPPDSDKDNPKEDEIFEEADPETTKNISF